MNAVKNTLNNYSSTIICYGATSAGKSHTAFGDSDDKGLAYQILGHLFEQL